MDPPPHFANERRPSRGAPQSSGSLLQRLPVELRLQIYDCLFPSKPVPYHGFDAGALRRDGQPSSTKVLRLSRAIHDEAEAYLYARTTFEVRIHPAGIVLCGGRHMTFPEYDFGKRGGPDKIHGVPGAWKALLRNVRRLDLRITAWVQRDLFNMVCKSCWRRLRSCRESVMCVLGESTRCPSGLPIARATILSRKTSSTRS
ncbi:uncharacterized protein BKA78DRAFT_157857 [Phyllosticta capitalensis]|uniref:uncharacterized protein n=1 Tax=Phyllosticta capitalensis TaxID=121624 RepID=UPI00312EAF49